MPINTWYFLHISILENNAGYFLLIIVSSYTIIAVSIISLIQNRQILYCSCQDKFVSLCELELRSPNVIVAATPPREYIVISGLGSRYTSVKNNEGNQIITFILWLLVNRCSVHVKQKSKGKHVAKKAHIIQCAFYLYSASAAEGGPSFDNYLLWGRNLYNIQGIISGSNLRQQSNLVFTSLCHTKVTVGRFSLVM